MSWLDLLVYNNNTGTWVEVAGVDNVVDQNYIHYGVGDWGFITVGSDKYPTRPSGTITGADTIDMNVNGGGTKTSAYTFDIANFKDQYGVQWPSPTWSENSSYASLNATGTADDSKTLTVDATPASTMAQSSFTITASVYGNTVATKTVTLRPTYKINFDAATNGGTAAAGVSQQTVVNDTNSASYANWPIPDGFTASRTDWTFVGWNGSATATTGAKPGGGKVDIDSVNDTLYAIFSKDVDVTYHYWTATGGSASTTQHTTVYNKATSGSVTAPAVPTDVVINNVTYTFKGWREDTTVSGETTNGTYTVGVNETGREAYAVYYKNTKATFYSYSADGSQRYAVTNENTVYLNCGAATGNPTAASIAFENTPANLSTDGRTFTFVGWQLDDTAAFDAAETTVGQNKDLALRDGDYKYYAVYSSDVTLSYNMNQRYDDGTDDVSLQVPSNSVEQRLIANAATANGAGRTSPVIAINPDALAPTRVGADSFLGWAFISENGVEGADTELEAAPAGQTLYPASGGTMNITTDRTLTAIFEDSRKTVKFLNYDGSELNVQTIRYNYGGTVPFVNSTVLADQTDGNNHYFFNGWTQNNDRTELYGNVEDGFTFDRVKDHVNFTASYTGQAHRWVQDDLATTAVSCNGQAGQAHAFVNGGYHRYCAECGYGSTDTVGNYSPNAYVTVEAVGADYIMIVNNRPATCTAKGSTGKQQCKICFKTIKEAEDVTPLGVYNALTDRYEHDMQPVAAPEGANYTLKRCAVCGHEERYYNADEHTLIWIAAAAATCTEDGYTVGHFYCTDPGCGKRFSDVEAKNELDPADVVVEALGHDWEAKERKEATCLENGYEAGNVCARCGELEDPDKLLPAGHPVGEEFRQSFDAVAATCQHPGHESGVKCLVCGNVIEGGEEIPQLTHKWSGIRVDMPTCTADGRSYRYCENPGCDTDDAAEGCQPAIKEDEYEVLTRLGHDMRIRAGQPATCTAEGVKDYYVCARCGLITSDADGENEIAAEALDEWKVIDPLEHELGDPQSFDPTCTEKGYTVRYCTREGCDYNELEETADALGHTGGTATCQARAVCTRCNKSYGSYGSHVWDNGTLTEGTCQKRAVTTYHCTTPGCNATKKENGSFGAHDYWVTSQTQPTCTAQGETVKVCQVCGDEAHEYVDALGHDVAEWTLDGTVAKGVCRRCGQEVTTTPAAAGITHKCEKCGLVHEGRTGIFVEDGLYCRIIGFFRRIFSMFG